MGWEHLPISFKKNKTKQNTGLIFSYKLLLFLPEEDRMRKDIIHICSLSLAVLLFSLLSPTLYLLSGSLIHVRVCFVLGTFEVGTS